MKISLAAAERSLAGVSCEGLPRCSLCGEKSLLKIARLDLPRFFAGLSYKSYLVVSGCEGPSIAELRSVASRVARETQQSYLIYL